ncbi:MAG: DUF2085 domain-containing protein [Anaerolineae bacterium]|nr:DUF2085 domain-containing protein [Thermoflexales bacterium]MDW8406189.1 DUF2085 domain-containing protein [Anaerolineae bacterium]
MQSQSPGQPARQPRLASALNQFAEAFRQHWLSIIVSLLLIYVGLPFLAPVLKKAGADGLAQAIYQPYKFVCHTYAFRSFFLFGDQLVYPRGEGEGEFERATGINPLTPRGLLEARDFQGNERVGYKVALCQRDIAIYLSMAINGMIFGMARRRIRRPIPWPVFVLIGLAPIAIDGFSQLLSQPPLAILPFRESTWALRVLTGALFGAAIAWLAFPLIESSFAAEERLARVVSTPNSDAPYTPRSTS